jgi:hypothetical protein
VAVDRTSVLRTCASISPGIGASLLLGGLVFTLQAA